MQKNYKKIKKFKIKLIRLKKTCELWSWTLSEKVLIITNKYFIIIIFKI